MIKINEIRFGNLIEEAGTLIIPVDIAVFKMLHGYPEDKEWNYIPLDADWLKSFGFTSDVIHHNSIRRPDFIWERGEIRLIHDDAGIHHHNNTDYGYGILIEYVHQLQNLVYSLSGEELILDK